MFRFADTTFAMKFGVNFETKWKQHLARGTSISVKRRCWLQKIIYYYFKRVSLIFRRRKKIQNIRPLLLLCSLFVKFYLELNTTIDARTTFCINFHILFKKKFKCEIRTQCRHSSFISSNRATSIKYGTSQNVD